MNSHLQLKLSSLEVTNYRCLKEVSILFKNPMTVLIGKNAAGKSTIIDVFEFVAEAIKDIQAAIKKRGDAVRDIVWGAQQDLSISLRFTFDVPTALRNATLQTLGDPRSAPVEPSPGMKSVDTPPMLDLPQLAASAFLHQLVYAVTIGPTFSENILCSNFDQSGDFLSLFFVTGVGNPVMKSTRDEKVWQLGKMSGPQVLLGNNTVSVLVGGNSFPNLLNPQAIDQITSKLVKGIGIYLRSYFTTLYHGSPHRKASLSLTVSDNRTIDPEGTSLVQVLHTLKNNHPRVFQRIESDLKTLVDDIDLIGTPIVEGTKTTLNFHQNLETIGEAVFSLKQMSSGTSQLLILLTQIHTRPVNSLILLEEIESMLHPSAQAKLARILAGVSSEKSIILCTHSAVIASQCESDSIILVKKRNGTTGTFPHSDILTQEIIEEMGIRPSFSFDSDKVVFVEGEYDEAVYRMWLDKNGFPGLAATNVLISAEGYSKIQFYANARILTRQVVNVETYAVFDGDTREKGDYQQVVRRLNLKPEHILLLKARNLESLLASAVAIKAAFPTLQLETAEIERSFTIAGDIDDQLKGAFKKILHTVGGYTATNAVLIASHLQPPVEWLEFFRRIAPRP